MPGDPVEATTYALLGPAGDPGRVRYVYDSGDNDGIWVDDGASWVQIDLGGSPHLFLYYFGR